MCSLYFGQKRLLHGLRCTDIPWSTSKTTFWMLITASRQVWSASSSAGALFFSQRHSWNVSDWWKSARDYGKVGVWGWLLYETVESLLTATIFHPIRQKIHTLTLVLNLSTAATFFHAQGGHCREVQQHWKGAEQASSKCERFWKLDWRGAYLPPPNRALFYPLILICCLDSLPTELVGRSWWNIKQIHLVWSRP